MKKGDLLWALALALIVGFLTAPQTHQIFLDLTKNHPYPMGFIKVATLATLGELFIVTGNWERPLGL